MGGEGATSAERLRLRSLNRTVVGSNPGRVTFRHHIANPYETAGGGGRSDPTFSISWRIVFAGSNGLSPPPQVDDRPIYGHPRRLGRGVAVLVVLNSIYIMLWVVPRASPTVQCRATCEQPEGVGHQRRDASVSSSSGVCGDGLRYITQDPS